MNIDDYISKVREQLNAAAALGDERTREIANALGVTVQSSVRLAIIEALSAAAAEANSALFAASGGQPAPAISFTVDSDSVRASVSTPPNEDEANVRSDDGDTSARISLRLSESLKSDIEQAATHADVSVNTWLTRVAAAAVRNDGSPFNWGGFGNWGGGRPPGRSSGRMTGWVTG